MLEAIKRKSGLIFIKQRLGLSFSKKHQKVIWLHAASVGETKIALDLFQNLSKLLPEDKFIITTNTSPAANIISENKKVSKKVQFKEPSENLANKIDKIIHTKDKALIKYQKKNKFSLSKFLSYIIVIIISFIGLILLLDTFKFQLFSIMPGLEFVLFSLFETLKDVQLFIKDLI